MQFLPDASRVTVALAVAATSNSQNFNYPSGMGPGNFAPAGDHKVTGPTFTELSSKLGHITITFNASNITVVNNTERTFRAGDNLTLDLDVAGLDADYDPIAIADGVFPLHPVNINLGTPAAADADGVCASQAGTADTAMTINGALASGGVATFDVPRNVVAAWTTTATLTVTGTDVDGNTIVETSASGTAMAGKKAFKTITSVVPSANITGATVGSGDVFGLPVFLDNVTNVIKEVEDGAAATAGTLVAGDTAVATATTGDVRGTYDPNSAADGSKEFELIALVTSQSYKGVTQYGG